MNDASLGPEWEQFRQQESDNYQRSILWAKTPGTEVFYKEQPVAWFRFPESAVLWAKSRPEDVQEKMAIRHALEDTERAATEYAIRTKAFDEGFGSGWREARRQQPEDTVEVWQHTYTEAISGIEPDDVDEWWVKGYAVFPRPVQAAPDPETVIRKQLKEAYIDEQPAVARAIEAALREHYDFVPKDAKDD